MMDPKQPAYDRWRSFNEFDPYIAAILMAGMEDQLIGTLFALNPISLKKNDDGTLTFTLQQLKRVIKATSIKKLKSANPQLRAPIVQDICWDLIDFIEQQEMEAMGESEEYPYEIETVTRDELLAFAEVTGERYPFLFPEKTPANAITVRNKRAQSARERGLRQKLETTQFFSALILAKLLKVIVSSKLGTWDKPNVKRIAAEFSIPDIKGLGPDNLEDHVVKDVLEKYNSLRERGFINEE